MPHNSRRSADLDVYTENPSLSDIADGDIAALKGAGFSVETNRSFYGLLVEAKVSRHDQSTLVEWSEADKERFFPVVEHPVFGWTLDPVDLAVQKLVAAATRRAARDVIDILLINLWFAPLAALAIAAPAKLAGASPTEILDRVLRNGIGHPQQEFEMLAVDRSAMPFDIERTKLHLADVVDRALEDIVTSCDQAVAGYIYSGSGTRTPQIPRRDLLATLESRGISERGLVPVVDRASQVSTGFRDLGRVDEGKAQ